MRKENRDKEFYSPSKHFICADMKLTTLGWVLHALEMETEEISVPENIRAGAKRAIDRMLEFV